MSSYTFGNYISELREKKGLTQSQLGERLGVTNKAVSKWENGGAYPTAELMLPLAKELGVSIEELYAAMTTSKKEKTKMRRALDALAAKSAVIVLCTAIVGIIMWILSWFFMEDPEKAEVLIVSPMISLVPYFFLRLLFAYMKRNPMAPSWYLDLLSMFFFSLAALGCLQGILLFIVDFPNGYPDMFFPVLAVIAGVLHGNKKRV